MGWGLSLATLPHHPTHHDIPLSLSQQDFNSVTREFLLDSSSTWEQPVPILALAWE